MPTADTDGTVITSMRAARIGRVLRVRAMAHEVLVELHAAPPDPGACHRLAHLYDESLGELADALSPTLRDELTRLAAPFRDAEPTTDQLRVADAQLAGWLDGVTEAFEAAVAAAAMAAAVAGQPSSLPGGDGAR